MEAKSAGDQVGANSFLAISGHRLTPPIGGQMPQGRIATERVHRTGTERVLYAALLLMALVGMLSGSEFNVAPAELIIEGAFMVSAALLMTRLDATAVRIFLIAGVYIAVKTGLMVFHNPVGSLDFIQAYKAYFYVMGLAFFVGRRVFSGALLVKVATLLILGFLGKYAYSLAFALHHRPGIYGENNFELVMLVALFYLAYPYFRRGRDLVFVLLAVVVLLSGSRSAAVCLLILYAFLYLRGERRSWPVHVVGVVGIAWAVATVFLDRMTGLSIREVDRFRFLGAFLRDVDAWPLWQFFTGSFPLTPLSPSTCGMLAYYSDLFSEESPGTCYSVVLHSYLLRGVFDHGFLGLGLLYGLVWAGLRRAGTSVRDSLALLGFITASAASISAFNNVFVAIALAVAMGLDRGPARHGGGPPEGTRAQHQGTLPELSGGVRTDARRHGSAMKTPPMSPAVQPVTAERGSGTGGSAPQ